MTFAETLRAMREERNLSQTDLARLSGVHPSSVSGYEFGKRNPLRPTLHKMATGMHLTPTEYQELANAAGYLVDQQHDQPS